MPFNLNFRSPGESSPLLNEESRSKKDHISRNNGATNGTSHKQKLAGTEKAGLDPNIKSIEEVSHALKILNSDDEELNHQVLRVSLNLSSHGLPPNATAQQIVRHESLRRYQSSPSPDSHSHSMPTTKERNILSKISAMLVVALVSLLCIFTLFILGKVFVGPSPQPIGPYKLFQAQEGEAFWDFYDFYEGADSLGSNGFINYVSKERAFDLAIANVTTEVLSLDPSKNDKDQQTRATTTTTTEKELTYIHMKSSPTEAGPRDSIRLEGKTRFNRGLFIIDLSHMPAGCGTWPAFWLTDEQDWPVNGEIDILEGVNYQTVAKTALHTTNSCNMSDVPGGVKTGTWDPAVGIPDRFTGLPDMTPRESSDCYVYSPHQWLNQGCVAVNDEDGTIGEPFNANGGGVYVLEWDPAYKHIRSWVFSPHSEVPDNLKNAIDTASNDNEDERVSPNPDLWGLPFGYFPIGQGTNCASSHFANMRIVINLTFCGSVAGNRFFEDCEEECKEFSSCDEYIQSNPKALEEAFWKIRGVYVYEREKE